MTADRPTGPVPGSVVGMRARRTVLQVASRAGLVLACGATPALATSDLAAGDTDAERDVAGDLALVARTLGIIAVESPRVKLGMPAVFPNGYSVPLTLDIDTPMSEQDHARVVHVLAPRNPIIVVAAFHFTPSSGRAHVSTRIRLAAPQTVLAVAEMSDGAVLMARSWVKVATDGCA